MDAPAFAPVETTERFLETGVKKAGYSVLNTLLLGLLGGAFIAFASEGSNTAIHTIESVGLAKALAGALFATGLMLVVVAGAELFTGNMIMLVPLIEKRIGLGRLLRNWGLVYVGNFVGSVLIAALILWSGQLGFSHGLLGGFTIKVATYKVGLTFLQGFSMGILCNWLVCMAVWMAAASKDIVGKLFAIFFPIWLFITSGFEHSVANMYYIPAGLFAASNPTFVAQAETLGVTAQALAKLSWPGFLVNNLIPVTLGNIVGGGLFVGVIFWATHLRKTKKAEIQAK